MSGSRDALTPLAIFGASGRMGRAVVQLAEASGFRVVCAIAADATGQDIGELAGVGKLGVLVTSDLGAPLALTESRAEVAIDFSHPTALPRIVEACTKARVALVSGTTGLDASGEAALDLAARSIPVLWEPNMSVGVHVLSAVVRRAIELLGLEFDVEVVEAHHKRKADSPSGTAIRLAEVAISARKALGAESELMHGREGKKTTRKAAEVGMHAVRGGDVIGDHTVHLLGAGERLELTHRATSRELFAQGALRAAKWMVGKPAGRVKLADVLG